MPLGSCRFAETAHIVGYILEGTVNSHLIRIGLVLVLPILCCLGPILLPVGLNEVVLYGFAQGLFEYPMPPDTKLIGKETEISHPGNGNSCTYEARLILLSTLPEPDIRSYYAGLRLPGVSDNSWRADNRVPVRLHFDGSSPTTPETRFTVILNDGGPDEATFDFRCH